MTFQCREARLKNSEGDRSMDLKELLGDSYKEGLTHAEIDALIKDKKLVDLSTGRYVDKDKFDKVVKERDDAKNSLNENNEKYKDYDTLKAENDKFKGEKADADLKTKLSSLGISDKAFKYVKGDIADKTLVIGDDEKANKTAVEAYLKEHPQFAGTNVPGVRRVVTTKIDNTEDKTGDVNKTINDNIRQALGRKVTVE